LANNFVEHLLSVNFSGESEFQPDPGHWCIFRLFSAIFSSVRLWDKNTFQGSNFTQNLISRSDFGSFFGNFRRFQRKIFFMLFAVFDFVVPTAQKWESYRFC
jgi:hypothetical protein